MSGSVGRVVLEFLSDTSHLDRGLTGTEDKVHRFSDRISSGLTSFGNSAIAVGGKLTAFVTGPVAAMGAGLFAIVQSSAAAGDAIAESARTAGTSAGFYQELQYALGQSGFEGEKLTASLGKITTAIGEAATGNKTAIASLSALGFTQEQIASGALTTEDVFNRMSTAIAGAGSAAEAAALAGGLVGVRMGPELAGALRDGGGQVDELRARFHALGLGLSDETLGQMDAFGDTTDELMLQVKQLGADLTTALLPAFLRVLDILQTSVVPFVREQVVPTVRTVIDWFAALPAPVHEIGAVVGLVFGAAGPIIMGVGFVSKALGALIAATGPVGLVILAATALYAAWQMWGDDIMALIGRVSEWVGHRFDAFRTRVSATWDSLKAYVVGVVNQLKGVFTSLPDSLLPLLGPIGLVVATFRHWDAITGIARSVYEGVKAWLIDRFTAVVDSIRAKVDAVTGFFRDMYDRVVGHSYVPDMVRGIGQWIDKLDGVMVAPTRDATTESAGLFDGMMGSVTERVRSGFGQLLDVTRLFKDGFTGTFSQMKSLALSILDDLVNTGVAKLTKFVTDAVGLTSSVTGAGATAGGSGAMAALGTVGAFAAGAAAPFILGRLVNPDAGYRDQAAQAADERQAFLDAAAYFGRTPEEHAAYLGTSIPGLATGGIVMPRSGGTLARIAEAGVPEAVIPLDGRNGLGRSVERTIVLECSGREIARATVPFFFDELDFVGGTP